MDSKTDLKNLTLAQLTDFVEKMGHKPFRARQIFSWLYRPGITDFSQMTDLTLEMREILSEQAFISRLTPFTEETSQDGTVKYCFRLDDGNSIESVLIPEDDRNTLCVSSQVGCALACKFCLTGTMGFRRNLRPSEIVNQVAAIMEKINLSEKTPADQPQPRTTNLVFMGMGEPLANFDNLITALDILLDQRGLNFSERRITVSTSGIVPRMVELGERTRVNLAVSLHAATDAVRDRLMPINKTYPVDMVLDACRRYPLPKRRRIMFEYILIQDVNDSQEDAQILAEKLKGIRCKINLLPFNECPSLPFKKSSQDHIDRFQKILWEAGYTVIVRASRGSDISAACGQLAGKSGRG